MQLTIHERRQARALFDAFLARFFENEMSGGGSRDMKDSFFRLIGMLSAPGLLLPVSNLWRWTALAFLPPDVMRREMVADKMIYVSMGMGAVMLLAAVVWQSLLADRRDAIVLGSFPVRTRTIVAGKLAALFAYVGIVAGGMHVVGSVMYGVMLGGGVAGAMSGVLAHFIAASLACMFACLAVAACQAVILAAGGPRLFMRITAPAQLVLAATGLMLILGSPMLGGAAAAYLRGTAGAEWVLWMPPMWFIGLYEVIAGVPAAVMPAMAARALLFTGGAITLLVAAYPLAYRRIVASAMQGSPLGSRRSIASAMLGGLMRRLPVSAGTRAGAHFILLTVGRVARSKLIVASMLGAAVAISLPFVVRWAAAATVLPVPGRSHIAVPFLYLMLALAGLRMAYNVPSEPAAAWIFSTAVRPARIGVSSARTIVCLIAGAATAAVCFPIYWWFWGPAIAVSLAITVFAFASLIGEIGIRTIDFVPFTRSYSPERGNLQARWPLFLVAGILFLQFFPWAVRALLANGNYWLAPVTLFAITAAVRYTQPPEPPPLVDADFENKPLALRLY